MFFESGGFMEKVLITGGTGFVGSHLTKRLLELDIEVHLIVRETSKINNLENLKNINIHFYDEKIETMIYILKKVSPDIVIHLASLFIAEHSSNHVDSLIKSNILFGTHLLEAMKVTNVNYIINTGTNWQNYYGEEYNPVDLYAATKEAFENIARYYTQTTAIRMLTLKLYDTYGQNDKRNKILSLFNKIAETQECLDMSPGEQLIGMVHIEDIIDAFVLSMRLIKTKDFHYQEVFFLNPNKYCTLKELVSIYEEIKGIKLNINFGGREYRFREVMKPYTGTRLPNWNPKIDIIEGLRNVIKND